MATNGSPRDPQLVEKIVAEVKSQGVFDEFRRGSIADVDTKPAYQNLRQRVDNSVKKFLSEQKWTPETNKNQLREKLRRYIADSGFLDVGVERIVDQVVNPKMSTVFRPKIEEIAYKYLNIAPPKVKPEPYQQLLPPLPPLPINGVHLNVDTSLLPTDLEQVSPDSDKATIKSEIKDDSVDMDVEKTDDDEESPPFEPLESCYNNFKTDAMKTHDATDAEATSTPIYNGEDSLSTSGGLKATAENNDSDNKKSSPKTSFDEKIKTEQNNSSEAILMQESQLSHVSSKSNANDITQSPKEATVNISEEAQMPNFCDNSSDENVLKNEGIELHFDIKKDEIKFEGTERRAWSTTSLTKNMSTEKAFDADDQLAAKTLEEKQPKPLLSKSSTDSQIDYSESVENIENFTKSATVAADTRTSLEDLSSTQLSSKDATESEQPTDTNTNMVLKEKSPQPPPPTSNNKEHMYSPKQYVSSSSSSRHKRKHSKEKYRSHEKEKERKDRDNYRDKYSSGTSSYKHTSSSSYHHKSHRSSSSHKSSKNERDSRSSSSLKNTTSSCSSSSRIDAHKYDSSSRRASDKHRKSSSSSKHASRRDKYDDHYEHKNKSHRRKSTDSNEDGDKSFESEKKYSSLADGQVKRTTDNHKTSSEHTKVKEQASDNCNTADTDNPNKAPSECVNASNVVILNELLENNPSCFIELDSSCVAKSLASVVTPLSTGERNSCNHSATNELSDNLLGFCHDPSITNELANTITMLDSIKENVRISITHSRSAIEDADAEDDDVAMALIDTQAYAVHDSVGAINSVVPSDNDKTIAENLANNNITEDEPLRKQTLCEQFKDKERTPEKRLKTQDHMKPSPTLSDMSVNSKENEHSDKDNGAIKKNFNTKNDNSNKLCKQQRYQSEDLYKPRPVLSQRSRRRGIDIAN